MNTKRTLCRFGWILLGGSLLFLAPELPSPAFAQQDPVASETSRSRQDAPRRRRSNRSGPPESTGKHGAIATGSSLAAQAGLKILVDGGNAVDAAVAALLVQSVTESRLFCFGGEVPILVYDAKRDVVEVLSGQGAAPRAATVEFYQENRKGLIRGDGDPVTAAVPALLDTCLTALDRYGTRSFTQASVGMVDVLRSRREPHWKNLLKTVEQLLEAEARSPNDRKRGLRLVADCFYRGPIARQIDQWSRENGGLIRFVDLATHVTRIEEPVAIRYKDYTVYKCGPWTQGPFLLQTLRLLEGDDLKADGHNSADYIHRVTEAMKLAFADRDAFYADPLYESVPLDVLLSDPYTELRRPLIDMNQASMVQRPGNPFKMEPLLGMRPQDFPAGGTPDQDTTTCVVADRWGNVVAATPSGWGGVMAGSTGVQLGSRLISLNVWPEHPNCVAPGKRPRNTLTPTLVLKDGKPVIAVSVAGGDRQDQTTLQILLNYIEFGFSPMDSISQPRFSTGHHINSFGNAPARLGTLTVRRGVDEKAVEQLKQRGHKIRTTRGVLTNPVMLVIDPQTGLKHAVSDPSARRSTAAH